jgi:hypothetical protein
LLLSHQLGLEVSHHVCPSLLIVLEVFFYIFNHSRLVLGLVFKEIKHKLSKFSVVHIGFSQICQLVLLLYFRVFNLLCLLKAGLNRLLHAHLVGEELNRGDIFCFRLAVELLLIFRLDTRLVVLLQICIF